MRRGRSDGFLWHGQASARTADRPGSLVLAEWFQDKIQTAMR
jgi:hypothetical protein